LSEQIIVTDTVIACVDPKGDTFLSVAVPGKANCIVADDRDFLEMISYRGILIYRTAEFLARFIR